MSSEIGSRRPDPRRSPRLGWIVTAAVVGVGSLMVSFTLAWPRAVYQNLALLTEVLSDIQKDYVVEVDSTRLVHDATVGMLTHLDGDNEVIDRAHAPADRAGNADVGLAVTRRGELVGERTFGVADVTKNIPLSDGSVVRLTVARYFTPTGQAIDRAGIAPDTSPRRPERSPRPRTPSSNQLRRC